MAHVQFRVHPSVGIARMGNSDAAFHITNEFPVFLQEMFPNLRPNPRPLTHPWDFAAAGAKVVTAPGFLVLNTTDATAGRYKDNARRIMPQAARFRVFAYKYANAKSRHPLRVVEVSSDVAGIEWRVWLGNVKSVSSAGGQRKNVFNRSAAPASVVADGTAKAAVEVKNGTHPALGYLFLEQDAVNKAKSTSRLLVIGNRGEIEGTGAFAGLWSDNWFDSAADGPVEAVVKPDVAKLRTALGMKSAETLSFLNYGTDAPVAAAAGLNVSALPAWCVVGLPDYSPDMGHFVSLHDIALEGALAAIEEKTPARKAKAEPGQHRRVADAKLTNDYLTWDYDVDIRPQLCLFGDVNATSAHAKGRGVGVSPTSSTGGPLTGHNEPPGPSRAMVQPRDANDDPDLRADGQLVAPAGSAGVSRRDQLKPSIFGRLRSPATLYREPRWFLKRTPPAAAPVDDDYDTRKVFPRRLGRRSEFRTGGRYPVDGAIFDVSAPANAAGEKDVDLDFPHEIPLPNDFRAENGKINRTTKLCGTERTFKNNDASAASATQRMLDDLFWPARPQDMPLLRELAYTNPQFDRFKDWATASPTRQRSIIGSIVPNALRTFFGVAHTADEYMVQAAALSERNLPALIDLAHMGSMLGGSFLPGIEAGREAGIAQNWSMYEGAVEYFPDLRFFPCQGTAPHPPGMLCKDLAVPWQVDFTACGPTYWPTSRPGEVERERAPAGSGTFDRKPWMLAETDGILAANPGETSAQHEVRYYRTYWTLLGFVRREGGDRFVERERDPGVP